MKLRQLSGRGKTDSDACVYQNNKRCSNFQDRKTSTVNKFRKMKSKQTVGAETDRVDEANHLTCYVDNLFAIKFTKHLKVISRGIDFNLLVQTFVDRVSPDD